MLLLEEEVSDTFNDRAGTAGFSLVNDGCCAATGTAQMNGGVATLLVPAPAVGRDGCAVVCVCLTPPPFSCGGGFIFSDDSWSVLGGVTCGSRDSCDEAMVRFDVRLDCAVRG